MAKQDMDNTGITKYNALFYTGGNEKIWPLVVKNLAQSSMINDYFWIGGSLECDIYEENLYYMNKLNDYQFTGAATEYLHVMHKHILKFIDMFSRLARPGDLRNKYIKHTHHEMLNIYYILIDFFANIIKKRNINFVFFSHPPNLGADYVLYVLAHTFNLKVLIVNQSRFPNRFFYYSKLEDYGDFTTSPDFHANDYVPELNLSFEHHWIYMQDSVNKFTFKDFLWKCYSYAYKKYKNTFPLSVTKIIDILTNMTMQLRQRQYLKFRKKYFKNDVSLNNEYIYFPLHLQPESSTSSFGDIYCDQILAIERLALKLRSNQYIYVKENPKQNFFMREEWFFKRLMGIKNVKLVSPIYSTVKLLKNALFTATVNGTAGWESITGGKPVLIFGNAWYKKLHGVFYFDDEFKIDEIINFRINHKILSKDFYNLIEKKSAIGIVDTYYSQLIDNYSDKKNADTIVNSLTHIIEKI